MRKMMDLSNSSSAMHFYKKNDGSIYLAYYRHQEINSENDYKAYFILYIVRELIFNKPHWVFSTTY